MTLVPYPRGSRVLTCDRVKGDDTPCDGSWVYLYATAPAGATFDEGEPHAWCDRHLVLAIQLQCFDVGIICNQPDDDGTPEPEWHPIGASCPECQAVDPFQPNKLGCESCAAAVDTIVSNAERRAGWDATP